MECISVTSIGSFCWAKKVKQGQPPHSFVGPAPRAQNHPFRYQTQYGLVLQRENRTEELEVPQTSKVQANMIVPSPPYYDEYYKEGAEEPAD